MEALTAGEAERYAKAGGLVQACAIARVEFAKA